MMSNMTDDPWVAISGTKPTSNSCHLEVFGGPLEAIFLNLMRDEAPIMHYGGRVGVLNLFRFVKLKQ
jgi:hypothetical protein